MTGRHSGAQKRLNVNAKTIFVLCTNHCLNLSGVHSVSVTTGSIRFFITVKDLYKIFSASTNLWDVMKKHLSVSLQRLSVTLWSAHAQSVDVLGRNCNHVLDALEAMQGCDYINDITFRFVGFLYTSGNDFSQN